MSKQILHKDRSYSFSDYFALSHPTKDVVAEFGYSYEFDKIALPSGPITDSLNPLKASFYKRLPRVSLTSEAAKREVLIAPILLELIDHVEVNMDIEYPVYVNEWLKGNIDYLLHSQAEFIVVEAKNADLEKGFTQLAVELIAMAQYLEEYRQPIIYGAVTVGNIWQFGRLDRARKHISKDIDTFRVPADIDALFSSLIGILAPNAI